MIYSYVTYNTIYINTSNIDTKHDVILRAPTNSSIKHVLILRKQYFSVIIENA